MEHLVECQAILEQLKKDFPLPESSKLVVSYLPVTLARRGRVTGGGLFFMCLETAHIEIAMSDGAPLRMRLERVAHEYRHAYQRLVFNRKLIPGYKGRYEGDAREFSKKYTKEYLANLCST